MDHGTPGMRIKRIPRFMNRSEDEHVEMLFEDCVVPATQMLGDRTLRGRGYCCDYAVERLFRDTRVDRIWEGTSEMMRSIILNGVMKRDLGELFS